MGDVTPELRLQLAVEKEAHAEERAAHEATRAELARWIERSWALEARLQAVREVVR